jgi:hypothetical protein
VSEVKAVETAQNRTDTRQDSTFARDATRRDWRVSRE